MEFSQGRKSINLKAFSSPEMAANKLVDDVISLTYDAINKNGRCVWGVSGGSSILKFYDALNEFKKIDQSLWDHLIVCWVDERHVPHEHPESNFGSAYNYFWKEIGGPRLISVPWNKNLGISGRQYEQKLITHGIKSGTDIDLLLLGMGTDGHTASLFPHSVPKMVTRSQNIAIQTLKEGALNRITMTYKLINQCSSKKVFAYGLEKGHTLRTALKKKNSDEYPILGVNLKDTTFYIDKLFEKAFKDVR